MNKKDELTSTNVLSHFQHNIIKELSVIGYMSVDVNREYCSDLSQLKFLNTSSNKRVSLDLNHNIDAAVKRTTDENNEKINLMLKFLLDKNNSFRMQYSNPDFITYRRTLISLMCCLFETEPVHIIASCFKGSIYLHLIESPNQCARRLCRSEQEQKYCAWGYKFEQYLLSDSPFSEPKYDKPVIENEEFSIYYHASLGGLRLLYGAQIDGLLTCASTKEIPNSSDFNVNVNYLRKNLFVELKTNREIQNYRQNSFKRYKLLRCWCQCYLAGLKGLYVGFRNDNGIIQQLKWYDTEKIPEICKNEWNPRSLLEFLQHILLSIKNSFQPYFKENYPISFKLEICSNGEVKILEKCKSDVILPNWYTLGNN